MVILPSYLIFLLRIDRQKDAIAEGSLEPFDRAILIAATARASADTNGADHLAVNNNGNTARVREESELHQLSGLSARIIAQLRRADGRRLARLQRRLGL